VRAALRFALRQVRARPLACFTVAFVLGLLLGQRLAAPAAICALSCGALVPLGIALRKRRGIAAALLVLIGLIAGMGRMGLAMDRAKPVQTRYSVLMEGRGERVRRIDDGVLRELGVDSLPSPGSIEVFCPAIFSSTPDVYREFRESDRGVGPNDLQPAALRLYPGIADALRHLEEKGLTRVTMSGSGSAVYGVKSAGSGC
jgi:hypothetical protein